MSLRWLTKVWDSSPYEGTALLIHLGMADHANEEGRFFLSQVTLSDKARCSVEYVRKTVKRMVVEGLVEIEKKGSSKGRATEYRLLPISVGQLKEADSPTLSDDSPTMTSPLPNSTPYQPSYTTVISTTVEPSDEGALAADRWWREQNPRPIGKRSWHILLQVCKAAAERDYTKEQIYFALNVIKSVPSMAQMDRQLRGVTPQRMSLRQERLGRGMNAIAQLEVAEQSLWQVEA